MNIITQEAKKRQAVVKTAIRKGKNKDKKESRHHDKRYPELLVP